MNLQLPETWGPATVLAIVAFALVGILGAVQVARAQMSWDAYIAALTALGSAGFIARGIWGRSDS